MAKALTLRMSDELHARLVDLAEHERRTLTAQILHMLDEGERVAVAARGDYDNQAEEYRELRRRGLARLAVDRGE
jgi:predicted transcriptional regulator